MLWVALAGGVRVEVDRAPIDEALLGGRQGRRLLARLAWEGRAVHRDELADGIWLESLPRTWERTLSGVITRLRAGLTEAGVTGSVITFTDGLYLLVGGGDLHVDVRDARGDLAAAREAEQHNDLLGARARAESALDVLRLPLLPGEDAAWVDVARARHGALLLDALDVLADVGLRAGWPDVAENAAREAVHSEPLREAGYQRLLRALVAKGDHAAVMTAYASCCRLLAEELGVSPAPDTEAIYREALGVEADVHVVASRSAVSTTVGRMPFPPTLHAHATTLIGREAELVWLWSLWRSARVEAPLTVVLHGPPGSGKRSLAAVFAREVHAAGGVVVHLGANDDDPADVDRTMANEGLTASLTVLELPPQAPNVPNVRGAALVVVLATARPEDATFDAASALGPLDHASVAAMVHERLGRAPSDRELDEWCSTTGGWPGALTVKLAECAAVRARTLTGEAARANASLVAVQADLAEEIMRGRSRQVVPRWQAAEQPPYKGLLRFEPEDADVFFGREQLVADVLSRLSTDRLVVVLGASGSGKSSMVRAGVVAELRRGALPNSDRWPVALLTPGRDPLASLTSCLAAATQGTVAAGVDALVDELDRISPSVVVVDQFEELFTVGIGERDRIAFVAALLHGLADRGGGHRVVIVVRSDFFDAASELPGLSDAGGAAPVVVPPPTELELCRIVSLPARVAGGVLEPGLVDMVIADSRTAPGSLPLVSTAMLESWSQRVDHLVTIESYRAAGGVGGAIAGLAEGVWSTFDRAEQRLGRSMFLRLSGEVGEVNNPVRRDELARSADAAASRVLDRLVRRRLVTVDDDTVRLAHEALLREWPRFQGWLSDDRVVRDGLHHLRRATADWDCRGRDTADLYRGTRLAAALDLTADVELSEVERSFLDASAGQQRAELRILRRRSRRLRALAAVLVVLLVLAVTAGVIAVARQREAADQARLATAQRLTREAESAESLDVRLLLAVEARRLDDSPEARGALVGQLTQAGAVVGILRSDIDNLSAVAVSPDGVWLGAGGANGDVSLWRLPDAEAVGATALVGGRVTDLAFAADGEMAVAGEDGEIARWRPGDGVAIRFAAHAGAALAVTYSRDGALLTAGADGLLRSFSLTTGGELWSTSVPSGAVAGSFDRDGTRYAQLGEDGELTVVDIGADGGRAVEPSAGSGSIGEATALALSADGRTVAVGDRFGGVHVVVPESGDTSDLGRLADLGSSSSTGGIEQLVFARSGEVVASAGGAIQRFDIAARRAAGALQFVGGRVTGLTVDPPGGTAAAVTETGELILLDLDRSTLARPLGNAGQPVIALSVDADGTVAAAGDGQVALLDLATDTRRVIPVSGHPVTAVSISDGLLAGGGGGLGAETGQPGAYTVVETESDERVVERGAFFDVTAVALQPGGELSAFGDERGQVRLLEWGAGDQVHELPSLPAAAVALGFSPAGDELVAVAADGTIVRWEPDGHRVGEPIELGLPATALAIAPDGRMVAVATADGAVVVDLATGGIVRSMTSPFGRIEAVSFGLDGMILATGGSGGVLLWDVASGRRLGDPLPAPGNTAIAFDTSGRTLITGK